MLRRPIACALLLWYLAACTTWHVEKGVSASQLISTKQPSVVRLTRANGSHVVVEQPRVVGGDSLAGYHNGVFSNVAVSDVTQVAIQKVSASKTVGLGLGMAIPVLLLVAAAVEAGINQNGN